MTFRDYRCDVRSRRLDLNAVRAIEVPTIVGFCCLAYLAEKGEPFSASTLTAVRLLPVLPFLLAFGLSTREPNAYQWLAIRAIHQAFTVVVLAVTAITLVGLPDTLFACLWLAAFGIAHLFALRCLRRIAPELPPMGRWQRALRVGSVFVFALGFLALK